MNISTGYVPYFTSLNAALTPSYPDIVGERSLNVSADLNRFVEAAYNPYDPGTISGLTKIASSPIPGCAVFLFRDETNELVAQTTSNASGVFAFTGLNKAMKFMVIVKIAAGFESYEYMVSSRRNPV